MDILTTDRVLLQKLKTQYTMNNRSEKAVTDLIGKVSTSDAYEYLSWFPDASVDLIFTDEPYAVFKRNVPVAGYSSDWEWDGNLTADSDLLSVPSPYDPRLPAHLQFPWVFEAARILKPNGVLVNSGMAEFTGSFRDVCKYAGLNWKASGPWIKTGGMPSLSKTNFRSGHEHFFVASKGVMRMNYQEEQEMLNYLLETECPKCGLEFPVSFSSSYKTAEWLQEVEWAEVSRNKSKTSDHPTEKPEWYAEKFLTIFGGRDKLIVDPFCGSGVFLEVAQRKGMRWSGNDYDPKWAEYTRQRCTGTL